ncbi:MAG: QueT transporter family protein [candidate division NC10 bacterium]|nr:QueT transporter family protein [candidate division NC10 bacterium]
MREIFTMWKYTKMVVLTALTAAVYAAILIPFKGFPIIPGFTEVRPATAIPVVFGLLFGPAAAWGSALGNLIGDFFGTLTMGSIFGFFGNFFMAFVAYKIWGHMGPLSSKREPNIGSGRQLLEFLLTTLLASSSCALIIAWGLELLRLLPFAILGGIITVNNFLVTAVLGPFLLLILYPRAERWDLLWTEIMEEKEISRHLSPAIGSLFLWIGGLGGLIIGLIASTGLYGAILFKFGAGTVGAGVVLAVLPFLVLFLIGCLLL